MAYGDIHNKTGTICRAQSDETCPLSADGGHSADLGDYAEVHGVDAETLRGLVENAKMAPKAALDLMGSGEMMETPPATTRAPHGDPVEKSEAARQRLVELLGPIPEQAQGPAETPQQRYEREMTQYKIDMVNYENQMLANYEAALAAHAASPFAPSPTFRPSGPSTRRASRPTTRSPRTSSPTRSPLRSPASPPERTSGRSTSGSASSSETLSMSGARLPTGSSTSEQRLQTG